MSKEEALGIYRIMWRAAGNKTLPAWLRPLALTLANQMLEIINA